MVCRVLRKKNRTFLRYEDRPRDLRPRAWCGFVVDDGSIWTVVWSCGIALTGAQGGGSHGVRHEGPGYAGLRREVDDCLIIVRYVGFLLF